MIPEIDIFVGNYTIIDQEVYELWIAGYSVSEAVGVMKQRGILETWGATLDALICDINDHYRTFEMLEKLLITPVKLAEEWTIQMHPQTQKYVIEKYYNFDDAVIREILGKKLSSRTRKDLDDVSEKTSVSLKSCRRQFDNVKKIFKLMDDMPGSIKQNIQTHYLLSSALAQKYATIVFLTSNRFETCKRRLLYLTFNNLSQCGAILMAEWTYGDNSVTKNEENGQTDCELERELFVQMRDLKTLLDKEKEHRNLTVSFLRKRAEDRLAADSESGFKALSRAIIHVATGLSSGREMRDFFVCVVERIVEPCRQSRWKPADLATFLTAYTESGADILANDLSLKSCWQRYMGAMQKCVKILYRA